MTVNNKTSLLRTEAFELIKTFTEYDGADRVSKIYSGRVSMQNGDPCLVTEYTYVGATSRVEKMLESQGTWSSAYDI